MYTTCMFCNKPLGSNEVVECFPIGRRLAFDAAKGRLWVVCRKCQRWNLTPLEERWEAVEACERLFRGTRIRASTEHIGIARHAEGLTLVRIGDPLRPEFAAWRYGDQFGRRRRRWVVSMVGGLGLGAAFLAAPIAIPSGLLLTFSWAHMAWAHARPLAKARLSGDDRRDGPVAADEVASFRLNALRSIRLMPDDGESGFRVDVNKAGRRVSFEGENARRVAAAIIPHLNGMGGSRRSVQHAVSEIESLGHPGRFLNKVANREHESSTGGIYVYGMPHPTRLALEMALHEEQERRALEGELWILEHAWKEAEEIAAISDNLLLPAGTDAFFDRHGSDA